MTISDGTAPLTRRRFIAISAAAAWLPAPALARTPVARWTGVALGAPASMAIAGLDDAAAAPIFAEVEAEVDRLEDIFSLYRPDSELSRWNRTGRLQAPPPELLHLVRLSGVLHRTTVGAFDPTIQPLWRLYAEAGLQHTLPSSGSIARTRQKTGWQHVQTDDRSLSFRRSGMAVTFNGIAQGFIADRIAAKMRARGLKNVLIDMGEIAALGRRPDGQPWRAGIAAPDGAMVGRVELADRALATSAPLGTVLDRSGRIGHILDPRTGRPGGMWQLVSVTAPDAALADGLSTAFCLMSREAIDRSLDHHPEVAIAALA